MQFTLSSCLCLLAPDLPANLASPLGLATMWDLQSAWEVGCKPGNPAEAEVRQQDRGRTHGLLLGRHWTPRERVT